MPAPVPLPCQQQWVAPETLAAQLLAVAFWSLHDGGDLTLTGQETAAIGITGARPAARAGLEGLLLRRLTRSALAPHDVGSAVLSLFSGKSAAGATLVLQAVLDDAVTRGYYSRLTPTGACSGQRIRLRRQSLHARLRATRHAGGRGHSVRHALAAVRPRRRAVAARTWLCLRPRVERSSAPPPDTDWGQLAGDSADAIIGKYHPGQNQSRPGLLELILNLLSRR